MKNILNRNKITFRDAMFVHYSTLGGLFSSIGSMFGKLSRTFEENAQLTICMFILMLGFNTMGMLFFAKALQASPSTIHATLVSSAANYISTAIIGSVFFGEKTPFMWWLGTLFITSGIVIISSSHSPTRTHGRD